MTVTPPRVSVVMGTYNRAQLLPRALKSVFAQTFKDFELILIDDCSTDDTPEVVRGFTDPRLIYLRNEKNIGCAAVRNMGIARARGEFVALVDDDDVSLAHRLEAQLRALTEAGPEAGLCLAGHIRWLPGDARYIGGPELMSVMDFKRGVIFGVDYSVLAGAGWMVRRSAVLQAGGFEPGMHWDDLELAIRLSEVCKIIHVEEPLWLQDHVKGSAMMRNLAPLADAVRVCLAKHSRRWEHDPSLMAKHYYMIGRLDSLYGDCSRARDAFRQGMRYRPFSASLWLGWLLARLGPAAVHAVTQFMRNRVRPLILPRPTHHLY